LKYILCFFFYSNS